MQKRLLGESGLIVSSIGLGFMRMSCGYGLASDKKDGSLIEWSTHTVNVCSTKEKPVVNKEARSK